MLTMPIEAVWNLRSEFTDEYEDFMHDAFGRLDHCHRLKLKAMTWYKNWVGRGYGHSMKEQLNGQDPFDV